MAGYWKQPEKRNVSIKEESDSSSSGADDSGSSESVEGEADAGEAGDTSRPATAASTLSEGPSEMKVIDALVIVPQSVGFRRSTTGSTGKTVTISTKSKTVDKNGVACLSVASPEEWADKQTRDPIAGADPLLAPFELVFEIKESGELVRSDTQKAKDTFPPDPTSIALAGITPKAVARLGDPHTIITDAWVPDSTMPLPNKVSMPFSPLQWLASYLKTHSPSYERHVARQQECLAWLTDTAQSVSQNKKM